MADGELQFMTFGDILRDCNATRGQLEHAILCQRIDPDARVGNTRVYKPETVERIKSALKRNGHSLRKPFSHLNWQPKN